ncbi:hypothetical protein AB0J71_46415 [Nonomuraea sp. NPDC049637]|uniref:hypothetical protein n=1 Tax=Nonomuraea sp. NPDC049637 TaxID=3154356 RepID=UPI003430DC59
MSRQRELLHRREAVRPGRSRPQSDHERSARSRTASGFTPASAAPITDVPLLDDYDAESLATSGEVLTPVTHSRVTEVTESWGSIIQMRAGQCLPLAERKTPQKPAKAAKNGPELSGEIATL